MKTLKTADFDNMAESLKKMSQQLNDQQAVIDDLLKVVSSYTEISDGPRVLNNHEAQLLKAINSEGDLFESDILSPGDMVTALQRLYDDQSSHFYTPHRVGRMMRSLNRYIKVRAMHNGKQQRLWVLRNFTEYNSLTASEVYKEYKRQILRIAPPIDQTVSFM